MKKLLNIELTDEEFDFFICEQNKGKELEVIDGKVIAVEHTLREEEISRAKIIELLQKLKSTDYIANKLIEAETEEERTELRLHYAEQLAERRKWRKEIDALQNSLNKYKTIN